MIPTPRNPFIVSIYPGGPQVEAVLRFMLQSSGLRIQIDWGSVFFAAEALRFTAW